MRIRTQRLWLALLAVAPCIALLAVEARTASAPRTVVPVLPQKPAPAVKLGAEALRQALETRGLEVRVEPRPTAAEVEVIIGEKGDPNLSEGGQGRERVSDRAESFAISIASNQRLMVVEGSDATGVMYGEFDVAEQFSGWCR